VILRRTAPVQTPRFLFSSDTDQDRSIGPIRSYDLPLVSSTINLPFMTVPLTTACFALLAALLHFVSYKLKKPLKKNHSTSKTLRDALDSGGPATKVMTCED
jgi:hypothetical protein